MMPFEIEWSHYLEAFRLHQGLTKASNLETRKLLRRSIELSIENSRSIPRSYGLLSFTILNAWLSNWIDRSEIEALVAEAIVELQKVRDADNSLSGVLNDLHNLRTSEPQIDTSVRALIAAYATVAITLDSSDFENHWSLATANLYGRKFSDAVRGYADAQSLADRPECPAISQSSLAVDVADSKFFAGNSSLDDSNEAYVMSIEEAIRMTEQAIAANSNDSKRHRWYWTLGWAYYELGGFTESVKNYARSLEVLQQIKTPHDLIRKNLIASYVALGDMEPATSVAKEFLSHNPGYSLVIENRWPYRNETQLERWKSHLRAGGLPD
jgi:tetratricopeptide (TPR) repeat protein